MKWYYIVAGIFIGGLAISASIEEYFKGEAKVAAVEAKRDVVVACYNSGRQDCDKLWEGK